ncbi:hypothetical protein [Streptomyces sp. GS7]|uniref:hypothetical protein n=1 Tax=Streptomyces sp. GS7 TaxID=2692234 RepID=UPI00131829BF|nr:hypothetical protein [Streptomyces sp. GS7]QHC26335.1 hypothetical protein GR130_38195 [Streptomyces sp. GS7]
MRQLRRALAAAAGSLILALALPAASAHAATGDFTYVYNDPYLGPLPGRLTDPPSRTCLNLPGAIQEYLPPAHTPRNHTASTATVFTGLDCTGDHFTLRPNGGHASERLKLRSVVFS